MSGKDLSLRKRDSSSAGRTEESVKEEQLMAETCPERRDLVPARLALPLPIRLCPIGTRNRPFYFVYRRCELWLSLCAFNFGLFQHPRGFGAVLSVHTARWEKMRNG